MLLSTVMMLRYLRLPNHANRLESAVLSTIKKGLKTRDVGGKVGTKAFVAAIIDAVHSDSALHHKGKESKGQSVAE